MLPRSHLIIGTITLIFATPAETIEKGGMNEQIVEQGLNLSGS